MRAVRDQSTRQPQESRPRAHPELRRFRSAGASGFALYRFPKPDIDAFYQSDLMTNYSEAVLIEGDRPLEWADLTVFVMRPSASGPGLLSRVKRRQDEEHEGSLSVLERALESPETLASLLLGGFEDRAVELAREDLGRLERMRDQMASNLARNRKARPPAPKECWAVSADYRGVERAQVVVVNIHGEMERTRGEHLLEEVRRLRTDEKVFRDVFRQTGSRVPITILVADLSDPGHPGSRKTLARIKRTLRSTD